ncbi:MAG TPA: mechanosensitive ion channel family protein [Gemmataceae bacterium]|nr:mechanosensitive ion channel family protein [Gemmataceae bacterium]
MHMVSGLRSKLADGRFDANLLFFYGLIVVTVVAALILRRCLARGGSRIVRWTGVQWLGAVGEEASRRARALILWLSIVLVIGLTVAGCGYHLAGGDIRGVVSAALAVLEVKDFLRIGLGTAGVLAAGVAAWFGARMVRRLRPVFQAMAVRNLGRVGNEDAFRRWFILMERYAVAVVRLAAVWAAAEAVGLGHAADVAIAFLIRVLSILAGARLLTLACRVLSHTAADLGDRYLAEGRFRHYWERVKRLFPFGERCFDAAVYILAASMCVRELSFIAMVAAYGPPLVQCIGILFGTRVLIELIQVLLNEAFGLYNEDQPFDQKGRTLVPLLQSVCQYALYFGAGVVMLGTLGIDTRPILAGAGILGLGVGLGAQSLITDVVSGFFILFENQYLVGDFVQVGDASGTVEAVSIRLTQIRDAQGKLFMIPNGQIKGVISYSKDYVNAVVDVRVPSGTDLEGLFRAMTEAGRRLRQTRKEVLAETQVHGLVELSTSEMTVRAVTKVRPGTHASMQNEYRRLLKLVFDQQAAQKPALAA